MDDIVTARLPQEIKKQGNEVFAQQGTTPSRVINELYAYVVATGELPDLKSKPAALNSGAPLILTPEMKRKLAIVRDTTSLNIDWGSDIDKPYSQLIEEGRRSAYEALA
jgi:hypothetical protein